MDILNTLKELNACFGPSGCEAEIREKIAGLAKPYADKIYTDVMGNLIVVKYAKGRIIRSVQDDSNGAAQDNI